MARSKRFAFLRRISPVVVVLGLVLAPRATAQNLESIHEFILPSYQRNGYAVKIGFGSDANFVDISYLRAKDDTNSLRHIPTAATVTPSENAVMATSMKFTFISELSFDVEERPVSSRATSAQRSTPKTRRITLDWRYTTRPGENFWFVIYRGGLEGGRSQFRAIEGKERRFIDDDTGGRLVYRYAVRVMTDTGESPFSDVAVVSMNR